MSNSHRLIDPFNASLRYEMQSLGMKVARCTSGGYVFSRANDPRDYVAIYEQRAVVAPSARRQFGQSNAFVAVEFGRDGPELLFTFTFQPRYTQTQALRLYINSPQQLDASLLSFVESQLLRV